MGYFDELLRKRRTACPAAEQTTTRPAGFDNNLRPQLQPTPNQTCQLPLWKLKLNDTEFDELKAYLKSCCSQWNHDPDSNPFNLARREAALFFAEYWRRLYTGGAHTKEMVYNALESNKPLCNQFYEAARSGAKALGIRIVRYQHLDSLLYQGGLPMKLVAERQGDVNRWLLFTIGLVNKRINFDKLDLGIVAKESESIRDYCIQLINGIEHDNHSEMPFYCEDRDNSWFQYITRLAKEEIRRKRESHPLSMEWVFQIDEIENKVKKIEYLVNGPNRLPQDFLERHNLNGSSFFSLQVKENNECIGAFDYYNGFCRNTVKFEYEYSAGNNIYIVLSNNGYEHLYSSDSLDMSIPHLLYQDGNSYKLGNFIGSQESLLMIPARWTLRNKNNGLTTKEFCWGEERISGIIIPANFTEDIDITGPNGESLTFGPNHPLYWTEIWSQPQEDEATRYIIEPVYNAADCRFALCKDSEDEDIARRQDGTVFRNRWAREWSNRPSYGEIFARVIYKDHFVTPIQLINIGSHDDLTIQVRHADSKHCRIEINWKHGTVSTNQGTLANDGCWEIDRTEQTCRKILFTFTPRDDRRNEFRLSIKAPFQQFAIFGADGKEIIGNNNDQIPIPYSDIDRWKYHIVGQEGSYTYGGQQVRFGWDPDDERLYILRNGQPRTYVPYEEALTALFGSREEIHSMLEKTSRNILEAKVTIQFNLDNGRRFRFTIKEFPYTAVQEPDGRVLISNGYKGKLLLFKMDDPTIKPREVEYDNEQQCHIIPEEIREWGKTLLTGHSNGHIRPRLVNLNRYMDDIARNTNRTETITGINTQLQNSAIGDDLWKKIVGWFKTTQSYGIPASSILELDCVSKDYRYLLLLALQLYAGCDSYSTENLKDQLITFSNDLAFQWYWLCPHLNETRNIADTFIRNNPDTLKTLYIEWVIYHQSPENLGTYTNVLNDDGAYFEKLNEMFNMFTEWMKGLCASSMTESYNSAPQEIDTDNAEGLISALSNNIRPATIEMEDRFRFIDTAQDELAEETVNFFNTYEEGRTGNEEWFYERVNAAAAHLRGRIDLFAQDDEIRRSIIYCGKSANRQFIISLNNKLSQA